MVVYGAFGTGKTKCLAMAAERLAQKSENKVLICTYSECAAGYFFSNWEKETKSKSVRLVRNKEKIAETNQDYRIIECSPLNEQTRSTISQSRLVVCTFYTSLLLNEHEKIPQWFTHILIDESSYALECEVIMPLVLATSRTTVVLFGDHKQLRPSITNCENLKFLAENSNFLERLLEIFKENEQLVNSSPRPRRFNLDNYFLILNEVHRTVRNIVDFISANFYNNKLKPNRFNAEFSGLNGYFPIQFVEIDQRAEQRFNNQFGSFENQYEANVMVFFVENLTRKWPRCWGPISIGLISNQTAQVRLLTDILTSNPKTTNLLKDGSIVVNLIQNLQGLQFRVTLVSTVLTQNLNVPNDNLLQNYVFSPFAANTCISRCEELCIVFGRTSLLFQVPEFFLPFSMQKFWKNYVSLCKMKKSWFSEPFVNNLYFDEIDVKIKVGKKLKRQIFDQEYYYCQFVDDFILDECLNDEVYETGESKKDNWSINDMSSDEGDLPFHRRHRRPTLYQPKAKTNNTGYKLKSLMSLMSVICFRTRRLNIGSLK